MSDVHEILPEWIAEQRWYGGKGRIPVLESRGVWSFRDEGWFARIETHLLVDFSGGTPALYQVPITLRSEPLEGHESALIGTVEQDGETFFVYDGPQDPAYSWALLRLILDEGSAQLDEKSDEATAQGHRQPGAQISTVVGSRVLSGEQSNTSIIYDLVDDNGEATNPIICKVFRAVHHGENPDVVLQSALAGAGSVNVPLSIGNVVGTWRDPGRDDAVATGHLAFAQEFLPGVQDAWRVAVRAAEEGVPFTAEAHSLGQATADVHATLAAVLPTVPASPAVVGEILRSFRERLATAVSEVPELAEERAAIERVYARAESSTWPSLQRIHADYHLGQVLAVPGRGWVLLDFEGEPLRPMHERSEPDVTLRDVAGMLRSFDYVAGSIALARPENADASAEWAHAARRAFLDGYIEHSGNDVRANRAVLDAFEIDKAVYEAIYESRNRPDWLSIPTTAVRRLAARA
ncbi:maltokinase N-terminal cap-like domain-containing protein [Planctomonas psychrotolerans]|uniref:maltokinase N-terminal cap-like domain-containing protein n=1 Tax=Planctomonas psychrotolerans TaxID=2528712 RepID=UPI001238E925|nr:phosphotransferase [Planctomonas psychrotolerans]